MQLIQTTLRVGAQKPFTVLHVSDTHLTLVGEHERPSRVQLGIDRRRMCPNATQNLDDIRAHVKQTGDLLIHTGDLIDFITPENLSAAGALAKDTDMLFVAGNHEVHTCPRDVFSEEDFTCDLARREQSLDAVQAYFPKDIRYFEKEVNGVKLIGFNTADYQISRENFDRLKQAAEQKKPIVLFTHIPLYSEELFRIAKNALIAIPDEIVNTFSPFRTFEQRADETTRQCYDFIQGCPYVKAIVSGHLHLPFESSDEGAKKQLVTSLDTLHEITIE